MSDQTKQQTKPKNQPGIQSQLEPIVQAENQAQPGILALQDQAGNTAVNQLLQAGRTGQNNEPVGAPSDVQSIVNSGGKPLDDGIRSSMESRFDADFSHIRVHANAAAIASAKKRSARAYTYGHHIIFGKGHYVPQTHVGHQLLAHELTHVIQQARGSVESDDAFEREAERAEQGVIPAVYSSVSPRPILQLSPERATRLIITIAEEGNRANFTVIRDEGEPLSAVGTASGLNLGEYQVAYNTARRTMIIRAADGSPLPETSQFYINIPRRAVEMHRLLRAATEPIPMEVRAGRIAGGTAESGQTNGPGGTGGVRQAVRELPERIRRFLFSETATRQIQERDYPTILRIGQKLMELSDSELDAYRARTVGVASDWQTFEASIDRYIAEVHQRREAVQERERTKLQLYGLDEVYQQYRRYKSMLTTSATVGAMAQAAPGSGLGGTSIGMQPTLNQMREELTANLRPYGFNSITEFEQSIREFEIAFRNETVLIARDMLDRYEHLLNEQEERYQNAAETATLHRQLQPAREHYERAIRIREEHASMMPMTPQEIADQSYWSGQFHEERNRGRRAVSSLSGTHPLLGNQDLPHEELALAGEDGIQDVILRYIRERRSNVQDTRRNLTSHPDMIFELDMLLQAAKREQDIRPGSIYDLIIQDHIHDTQIERTIINLAIAVFAIAAGLLSGGTGTVAVLGAAAAAGVGAYQAVEEFRRYERMSAAHGAQLLSDDPSFAWVIVAIVGAGIDLAAAGAAIRALRPAVQAFNAGEDAGNLVALERRLAQLTQVEERIRRNVLRAAEVEAQTRAAWRNVFRPPAALRAVIVPGAEEFGRLVYAVYLSAKRGIISFERFIATREAVDLIGDIARLTPEELTSLKAAYRQAVTDSQNIARHGHSLGMTEDEIHAFMRLHNNRRGMTAEHVMQEMDTWRATRQSGVPFGFRSTDQFTEFQATAQAELRRLLRRSDPNAEAFLQGSSVSGISYSRQVPFDVESDLDVAISSRSLFRRARTELGLTPESGPRRIGPLSDEQARALGLGRLHDRLRRILASGGEETGSGVGREINFLLFENERAVRQPIRGSTETTRAAVPLREE